MSDPGTGQQPPGEQEASRAENQATKPKEEPNITEDSDGTPKENPSG